MARGRQFLAARVYERAQELLTSSVMPNKPNQPAAWVPALTAIPPAEILTRPYPMQHTAPRDTGGARRRPPNLFRPTKIAYPEDRLRRDFYRDHPWELARPKLVLELDGQDARLRDWSRGVRQPGMALSGEW